VETLMFFFFQDEQSSKEQHLFEIEYFLSHFIPTSSGITGNKPDISQMPL